MSREGVLAQARFRQAEMDKEARRAREEARALGACLYERGDCSGRCPECPFGASRVAAYNAAQAEVSS